MLYIQAKTKALFIRLLALFVQRSDVDVLLSVATSQRLNSCKSHSFRTYSVNENHVYGLTGPRLDIFQGSLSVITTVTSRCGFQL